MSNENYDSSPGDRKVETVQPTAARKRLFSLDVLRGMAALLVLIRHLPTPVFESKTWYEPFLNWLSEIGWIGVDLFFVLSGFLISSIIFEEYDRTRKFDAWRFWVRRSLKIWPTYYVAYAGVCFLQIGMTFCTHNQGYRSELLGSLVWNSLFLQNYVPYIRWPHSWSIAVEEHFYTGLALVLFLVVLSAKEDVPGKKMFAPILALFAFVAVCSFSLRWDYCFPEYNPSPAYYRSHLRADSLLAGVALGYVFRYHNGIIPSWLVKPFSVFVFMGIAVLTPSVWKLFSNPLCETVGFLILYTSFGVVVVSAATSPETGLNGPKLWRFVCGSLARLGLYSYTVYVAHSVLFGIPGFETGRRAVLIFFEQFLGAAPTVMIDRIGFLFFSIGLGVILAMIVEQPVLRWRSEHFPSR